MPRYTKHPRRTSSTLQFPERLRAARIGAAVVIERGVVLTRDEQRGLYTPRGEDVLRRHAEHAAALGLFAEGRRAA